MSKPEASSDHSNPVAPLNQVDGAFNLRCFGGYPSNLFPGAVTRRGVVYRAGHLMDVTPLGWNMLHTLQISTIIDLTKPGEVQTLCPRKVKPSDDGYIPKTINLPLKKEFCLKGLEQKYETFKEKGAKAVAQEYMNLLREGSNVVRDIILLILNDLNQRLLIHCTLGKDRTGIVFALLLSIAGVSDDLIATEYSWSAHGLQPMEPTIIKLLQQAQPSLSASEAYEKVKESTTASKDSMLLTLKLIRDSYGGVHGYLRDKCGLSENEIHHLRQFLVCSGSTP